MGDGEEDDPDDDDDLSSRSVKKRGLDGKLKPPQDLTNVRAIIVSIPINLHFRLVGIQF
jgi:hypothetical protein